MKKIILLLVGLCASALVKAQGYYNYQEFGVGIDASYMRGYTNLNNQYNHPELNMNFIYNYNPYLPITAELQTGELSGGGLTPNLDKYGRVYDNHYKAFFIHGDFQLGAAINYSDNVLLNLAKNFYLGTGIGLVANSIQNQRYSIYDKTYRFPGNNSNFGILLPLRVGYEIKLYDSYSEPAYAIDFGYIHNIALAGNLDGYNDPVSKFKNNAPDQYRQIFVGFKYYFGSIVSYNKAIRY